MAEPVFDTQQAVKHLRDEAGFEQKAAEAMVEVLANALAAVATKRDLEDLRVVTKRDLDEHRTETKRDLSELRTELKHDQEAHRAATEKRLDQHERKTQAAIDGLRQEMDDRFNHFETRLTQFEQRLESFEQRLESFEGRIEMRLAQAHADILKNVLYTMTAAMTGLTAIFALIDKLF